MEAWSPYASMFKNPVLKSDPLGDEPGPNDDGEPKQTAHFRQATDYEWQERPIHAAVMNLGFFAAEFLGLTSIDNAISVVKNDKASTGDKLMAVADATLATARGEKIKSSEKNLWVHIPN